MSANVPEVISPQQQALAIGGSILGPLEAALKNPELLKNVEALDKLLAMQERLIADQRRIEFVQAMARLAPLLPEIKKHGDLTHLARKYAKYEDVERGIRPLYTAEGFSIAWNTADVGGKLKVIGKLSHVGGHFEVYELTVPHDAGGGKNAIQAVISAESYAKRVLTIGMFNLVILDADKDGDQRDMEPIGDEKALDLKSAIESVGGNLGRFCKHFEIEKLSDLPKSRHKEALQMVEDRRKSVKQ